MPTITNARMQLILTGSEVTVTCTYDLTFSKEEIKLPATKYKEWILLKGVDTGEQVTHTGDNIISWDYVGMFPLQTFLPNKNTKPETRSRTIKIPRWRLVEDQYKSDDEIQCEIKVHTGSFNEAKPVFTNVAILKRMPRP